MGRNRLVKVDYAETQLEIPVPEDAFVAERDDPAPLPNPEQSFRQTLEKPIGIKPLRELAEKGARVTIAFDAPPRSGTPRRLFIPILLEELQKAGVPERNVTLICASGSQWKRTRNELCHNLGPELFAQFWPSRLINHDCSQGLIYLGESELGDHVEYNKAVAESDILVYLGTISANSWGGFSGTGVVIGLGSARCIRSHHTGVIAHPDACHGDPRKSLYMKHKQAIHAQVEKATGKKIFYADAVVNTKGEICSIVAGHCPEINEPEWTLAEKCFRVSVPQADVLVAGLPAASVYGSTHNPLLTLTYSAMVMRNWVHKPVLKPGGGIYRTRKMRRDDRWSKEACGSGGMEFIREGPFGTGSI